MDPGHVDKLAKYNNGLEYQLTRQNLIEGTVDAKGMKTKYSKETIYAFMNMTTEKLTQEFLGRQGNKICWRV